MPRPSKNAWPQRVLPVLLAVAALAGGFAFSQWWRHSLSAPAETTVTDLALPDLYGKTRRLSEWQGKVVVLNFWATWCQPCLEEIPLLTGVHDRYRARGVQVVGIAIDTERAVGPFATKLGIDYPLLMAEETGLELMAGFGNSRGALPFTVILDREGRTLQRKLGAYTPGELEKALDALDLPPALPASST